MSRLPARSVALKRVIERQNKQNAKEQRTRLNGKAKAPKARESFPLSNWSADYFNDQRQAG